MAGMKVQPAVSSSCFLAASRAGLRFGWGTCKGRRRGVAELERREPTLREVVEEGEDDIRRERAFNMGVPGTCCFWSAAACCTFFAA